jgi:SWI/SNF-related matrix-associated actin-dependent regulator 1 of chromatin subfamily A
MYVVKVGSSSFETREHDFDNDRPRLKKAGWRWNPRSKVWHTNDPERVVPFIQEIRMGTDRDTERVKHEVLAHKGEYDRKEKEKQVALEESRATDADIEIPSPDGLDYLPFQRGGIAYALKRDATLIGDPMGLGKTIQAIGVANATGARKILIICPASIRLNWAKELRKWLTEPHSIQVIMGSGLTQKAFYRYRDEGITLTPEWGRGLFGEKVSSDVHVVNYELVARNLSKIHAREWDLVIVDEAHYLKNRDAQRTRDILGYRPKRSEKEDKAREPVNGRRLLFLTGTPILNRPIEFWTLANRLDPQYFSKFFDYARQYCDAKKNSFGWDFTGASNLERLQMIARQRFLVRREKHEVLTELPAKRRIVHSMPVTSREAQAAIDKEEARESELARVIQEAREACEMAGDDPEAYKDAVQKLRESESYAFTEMAKVRHYTALAKVGYVVSHVKEMLDSETEKVVVFAHHKDVIESLMIGLREYSPVKIDGSVAQIHRQDVVEKFQNIPAHRVFVGSIQAAGVGLTLTASSDVVFAELDWVPGNMSQAEDRCHRIGQQDSVLVQHIVLDGSIDQKMATALIKKQEIIERALDKPVTEEMIEEWEKVSQNGSQAAPGTKKAPVEIPISDDQNRLLHLALQMLAGVCDGARALDGAGFNRYDAQFGLQLAMQDRISRRQAQAAYRMIRKYHKQLPEEVINGIYETSSRAVDGLSGEAPEDSSPVQGGS